MTSTSPASSTGEERQSRNQTQPALEGMRALQPQQSTDPPHGTDSLRALEALREEIDALRRRQDAYEPRLADLAGQLADAREFRERAEVEISSLQTSCAVLAAVLDEMTQLPAELRISFEPELSEVRGELQRQLAAGGGQTRGMQLAPGRDVEADLRTAAGEISDEETGASDASRPVGQAPNGSIGLAEQAGPAGAPGGPAPAHGPAAADSGPPEEPARELVLPLFAAPAAERRSAWLAASIDALANTRSAALAADLVAELVPLHATLWDGELSYRLQIEGHGALCVQIAGGRARLTHGPDAQMSSPAFRLSGSAAAFAGLAGGGLLQRPAGLRVRGSRRQARRLLAACARPVALVDLVEAGVTVWPGLLLAALREAVDARWTTGSRFAVAYEIEDADDAAFVVTVRDGAPLSVVARPSRQGSPAGRREASPAGERRPGDPPEPQATVRIGERAFLAMLAGVPLPDGCSATVMGDDAPALALLDWFARAQGLAELAER